MSKYSKDVIQILYTNQDEYISGQFIAEHLAISRTAVKKVIDQLKQEGCEIESINHKGHRLIELPDKWYSGIVEPLIDEQKMFDHVEVIAQIDSTQLLAKQKLVGNTDTFLILSDEQTKGKGRFNRPWDSSRGKGLWMSIVLRPKVPFEMITKFNLFMALGIRDTMQQFSNESVTIKWPNDIYIDGKKACGFLTEMVANSDGIEAVICGIGINMNHLAEDFQGELQLKATSLRIHANQKIHRYHFLEQLINHIERRYHQFLNQPFSTIRNEYIEASNIWNRSLKFTENAQQFQGEAVDIDEDGYLIVIDDQQIQHKLMSADIEL
ncbi:MULTISPECIES: biotin--[acetyl-CoA-carboxylase] ligase [Staphylococcus]|uniref:biotin--[acetyl-CoA-carboxylase] ligase n=1 Tax=Staphylococcus TaxID=1279 RepID=UPI000D1A0A8E|nr:MULTISPECIES: biotin--[acetyl-CoA-carboxylase] ligase [Staphylococcus]MCE5033924.1 biotin--[acetyl-CoA-carboxylase] ligase [Staphylococcus cohnii]MCE5099576.1 biotin--[acetyl-CoA-carboxylase] ligase [Staphylococcus cohnii]MSU28933.1 biotin--[acetyl-CoA-carboxylase] ligase [Staphylococcus sp. McC-251-APC-3A2]PTE79254.1 biotin--[acetyl-CoA-carboxylase] ligase [Staphylococcus cohnii]PTF21111.1 biotin--[acetyl-CoA-carboxylase] ligase [Staphylococcus cohnii]